MRINIGSIEANSVSFGDGNNFHLGTTTDETVNTTGPADEISVTNIKAQNVAFGNGNTFHRGDDADGM
jgi:hypothetical protein